MKDLKISVNKETRYVNLSKSIIGVDGENLQEKIVFSFEDEFVDGTARLEFENTDGKQYVLLEKENEIYSVPVKNVITKEGNIKMQLVITEGTDEENIPVFKSNQFYLWCEKSINAVEEAPDSYELWIETANEKLNEIDNIDIDLVEEDKKTKITITRKDGTTKETTIAGGDKGVSSYPQLDDLPTINGVELIGNKTSSDLNMYTKEDVNGLISAVNSFNILVVDALPIENIDTHTIYLIHKQEEENDNYDEYIYVNDGWEHIGSTSVDLSDYYKKPEINNYLNINENGKINFEAIGKETNSVGEALGVLTGAFEDALSEIDEKKADKTLLNEKASIEYVDESLKNVSGSTQVFYLLNTDVTEENLAIVQEAYDAMQTDKNLIILVLNALLSKVYLFKPLNETTLTTDFVEYSFKNERIKGYTTATETQQRFEITANDGIVSGFSITNSTNTSFSFISTTDAYSTGFNPTKAYHPASKRYVDNTINTSTAPLNTAIEEMPNRLLIEGFDYVARTRDANINYEVTNLSEYGFELQDDGYYKSTCEGILTGYSLCKVIFNNEEELTFNIDIINNGEQYYDYGILGKVDVELEATHVVDSEDKIHFDGRYFVSPDVQQVEYTIPAGEHFICIKYRKDGSGHGAVDSLKFKVPDFVTLEIIEHGHMAVKEEVDTAIATAITGALESDY